MTTTLSAPSTTRPRVSVIVPVLNGIRTIRPCLDSLTALQQARPDVEVLVVDNGSTDGTRDVVREYPTVQLLVESEIRGPSAARNAGAQVARGDILAFTDADCVVTAAWLEEALPRFLDCGVVGVGGAIEGVAPQNAIQQWMNDRRILDQEAALHNPIKPYLQTANAFFRRQAVLEVSGFDPSLPYGEDCDLSWRIQEATGGRLDYAAAALVYHDHRCSLRGTSPPVGQERHGRGVPGPQMGLAHSAKALEGERVGGAGPGGARDSTDPPVARPCAPAGTVSGPAGFPAPLRTQVGSAQGGVDHRAMALLVIVRCRRFAAPRTILCC